MTSTYGKGFVYNLFLFAKHWERYRNINTRLSGSLRESGWVTTWFNGAADHLFELQIPPRWKKHEIGKRIGKIQHKGISHRMFLDTGGIELSWEYLDDFFDEIENVLLLIDKELGLEPEKAEFN